MVRTVADRLYCRLIEDFPADRVYTKSGFDRESMPQPIAQYLEHVLRLRLDAEEERLRRFSGEWFEVDNPEVNEARRDYVNALSSYQRIPTAAWPQELRRACEDVVWYLVQPSRAIADVVFRESKGFLTMPEVFRRMQFFSAYPYFGEVLAAYVQQKGVEQIDSDRLSQLLRRIDRQLTEDYDVEKWLDLLNPLLDLMRSVPGLEGRVPVHLAVMFFSEKKAETVRKRLDDLYGETADRLLSRDDLAELFGRHARPVQAPVKIEAPPVAESRPPVSADGPLPLWKQFEHRQDVAARPPVDLGGDGTSEPLWKRFHREPAGVVEPVQPHGPIELSALERTVLGERGARDRELFVRHLFSGSTNAYEDTLKRLRAAADWTQASKIIAEDVFLKHQVNIYSEPAVTFTDAAEARFRV